MRYNIIDKVVKRRQGFFFLNPNINDESVTRYQKMVEAENVKKYLDEYQEVLHCHKLQATEWDSPKKTLVFIAWT